MRCALQAKQLSTPGLVGRRPAGTTMVLSVLGDTFADIVCLPLESLPTWGTDSLVSEPIRIMLGGSAANFAVHTQNLNRAGQFPLGAREDLGGAA
ncbi:unnamed protein product, partial [Laminaria digitata]